MIDAVIYTPTKKLFEGNVESIIFPGEQGIFEVLSYHKPIVTRLLGGNIVVDGDKVFSIRCGICGISRNKATVVVEQE
jgi:F-type H+-transporting ATPase subunit epsilon